MDTKIDLANIPSAEEVFYEILMKGRSAIANLRKADWGKVVVQFFLTFIVKSSVNIIKLHLSLFDLTALLS